MLKNFIENSSVKITFFLIVTFFCVRPNANFKQKVSFHSRNQAGLNKV
jgi:hypothetical protein